MEMELLERDVEFEGLSVRVLEAGEGFPLMLLHGSGPGVSALGNFRLILGDLAKRYRVFTFDLIGFGQSARKPAPPYFDFELWLRQAHAMLHLIPGESVGLIGHSISASLALRLAATERRVAKVLTTGAMGISFPPNEHTIRTWTFPETREELRRAGESLVYDKKMIDEAWIEGRAKVLYGGDYAEYFRSMFAGDKQPYINAAIIDPALLRNIQAPVLMVHGRDDAPFPYAQTSLPISRLLPNADLTVLARCGHSPALEHPGKLVALAAMHFG
jgi:2-hydroxymuconate-semialdehyde hydrolase